MVWWVFPQCVAKGSCFLGRGCGGGGVFAAVLSHVMSPNFRRLHCLWLWEMSQKLLPFKLCKCISRGRRGTLWHPMQGVKARSRCLWGIFGRKDVLHGSNRKVCKNNFKKSKNEKLKSEKVSKSWKVQKIEKKNKKSKNMFFDYLIF
jgi:hypothetical protein